MKNGEGCVLAILAVVVFLFITLLFAFVIQWAWNIFMPYVFKLPEISLLQAFALSILTGIFTSFIRGKVEKK